MGFHPGTTCSRIYYHNEPHGYVGYFQEGVFQMITGQFLLTLPMCLPHRLEQYTSQAEGRGFES
ncbi:MAG TPA: hypothetical protein VMV76_04805, partial [Dehalococcoidia bacterium]|nr:hypothetical protein [Dehalococcoidia bacterium]